MSNNYFQFKQFTIHQDRCAMKVTTDACLFGAWLAEKINNQRSKAKNILDIGTGTGLLSLMLSQKADAIIDAIEIDKDSFEQASENIKASPWAERINIIHDDARHYSFSYKYDIIISNPPFYENELKSDDKKKNIAHHGDDLSLKELLTIIKNNLVETGRFFLLLPYKRNDEIKKMFSGSDLSINEMVFVKQTDRHSPFRIMISGKLRKEEPAEILLDEIVIKDKTGQYTERFIVLLKEYYSSL